MFEYVKTGNNICTMLLDLNNTTLIWFSISILLLLKTTNGKDNISIVSAATFTTGLCCLITNLPMLFQITICISMYLIYKCVNNLYRLSEINIYKVKKKNKSKQLRITNNQKLKAFYK